MSDPTIQATVSSTALNRLLHAASRAGSRSAPIYEMVQLAVRKGTLYAKCFNGAMGISAQTSVENQGAGFEALVNVQTLASLVSAMNGPIELIPEPNKGLRIECGTANAKLTGLEDALPQIDDPKAKSICTLSGEALSSVLRVSACAAGDTALHLNGVFVDVSASKITTWTADGVRAAACETAIEGGTPARFLLPLAFVSWLQLFATKATVVLKESGSRIIVTARDGENGMLTMSSPKGEHQNFPHANLETIFDKTFSNEEAVRVMVDANLVNLAVRQVKAFGSPHFSLHTEGNNLCVMSAATSMGQYHNVVGNAGETLSIYLHPHITDGLALLETPEVVFTGARGPLGLQEGLLRMVFMPMIVEEPISRAEAEPEETEAPIAVEVPVAAVA
jgi:DNA polymerase III sliding clamp (beta) subunit (PCNA family)